MYFITFFLDKSNDAKFCVLLSFSNNNHIFQNDVNAAGFLINTALHVFHLLPCLSLKFFFVVLTQLSTIVDKVT